MINQELSGLVFMPFVKRQGSEMTLPFLLLPPAHYLQ